ncbi:MAG: phosphatase PAP2 family protein [Oscillospiraceae bacterium]|nr:phosphatase PAP2 family protein [Oscillospiraceae bacterium]
MDNKITKSLIIINIISFLFFIFLAYLIVYHKTASFDSHVYNIIAQYINEPLTIVSKILSDLGDTFGIVAICLILLLIPKTRFTLGLPVSITVTISALLNTGLKYIFKRPRPNILRLTAAAGYSFPSGHSMNNMVLYCMITLCISLYIKNKIVSYLVYAISYMIVLFIGLSRIYLGVHYASDVVAGFSIGIWTATTSYMILRNIYFRKRLSSQGK